MQQRAVALVANLATVSAFSLTVARPFEHAPLGRPIRCADRVHMASEPFDLVSIMIADAGGISSTADELAGSLFGASLFPWLGMLYWLRHPTVAAPPNVTFGLTFLLAFVFGSIPAAITAGAFYGVSLADCDWLHGAAESLLAITNCIVVLGFRDALSEDGVKTGTREAGSGLQTAATALGALAALSGIAVFATGSASVHTPWLGGIGNLPAALWASEPVNALSVPTWIIHTSSLVEWLVAMGLAWRYADAIGKPEWKGVTWGMLPLHTSGIIACTYHLFYNAPAITWCVALQAGMTCIGNCTLAFACLRLALASGWTWQMGQEDVAKLLASALEGLRVGREAAGAVAMPAPTPVASASSAGAEVGAGGNANDGGSASGAEGGGVEGAALVGWEDLGDAWARDSDLAFLAKLLGLSASLAYLVKYAPAAIPLAVEQAFAGLPDEGVTVAALAVIVLPTLLNCAKWAQRSKEDAEFVGDF